MCVILVANPCGEPGIKVSPVGGMASAVVRLLRPQALNMSSNWFAEIRTD